MALLYINVINPSHAISGMSKTSNMKDHLNQGWFISYIQEIYLKFFNNGTVHANFLVQTAVQTCKSFIPFNMNSKNLEHELLLITEMHICSPDITCITDSTLYSLTLLCSNSSHSLIQMPVQTCLNGQAISEVS